MTFTEAVQALADGRCESIEWHGTRLWLKPMGNTYLVNANNEGPYLQPSCYLATDWELVNPKPEVEEVEIETRWCVICNCVDRQCLANKAYEGHKHITLKGTYTRPKPRTVKRKDEFKMLFPSKLIDIKGYSIPGTKDVRYFAEWQEEVQG